MANIRRRPLYDLIGDIHGHASALKRLLGKLGYRHDGRCFRHPERRAIFLGDFVDRGPEQLEGVQLARGMVEGGAALAVMGNHEFNAVAYATPHPERDGEFLRAHSAKNTAQHRAFLDAVGAGSALHDELVDWFRTLPVYLELEGLRVVHACWHNASLWDISPHLDSDGSIRPASWPELSHKGTRGYAALETLLKGYEIALPEGHSFPDKDGNPRRNIRTCWWTNETATYQDIALVHQAAREEIPDLPVGSASLPGYDNAKPLFLGHYWLTGQPAPTTDKIAILDYSVAAESDHPEHSGKLCAYRWNGEQKLTQDNFVWVDSVPG